MRLRAAHILCLLPLAVACGGDAASDAPASEAHRARASTMIPITHTSADGSFNAVYVDPRLLTLPAAEQQAHAGKLAHRIVRENAAAARARMVVVEFTNQEDPHPPKRAARYFFPRAQLEGTSPPAPPVPARTTSEMRWTGSRPTPHP